MKNGKYLKLKKRYNKVITLILCCLLLACCTVGGTIAYLSAGTGAVTNTFTPAQVIINIEEDFDGETKKDVTIKVPSGDNVTDAFVRAQIVVSWMDSNGNVLGETPKEGTDYTLTLGSGWFEKGGYYYWPNIVNVENPTGGLLTASSTATKEVEGTTYYVSIDVLASGIQAAGTDESGKSPVELAWGVAYDSTSKTIS